MKSNKKAEALLEMIKSDGYNVDEKMLYLFEMQKNLVSQMLGLVEYKGDLKQKDINDTMSYCLRQITHGIDIVVEYLETRIEKKFGVN